MSGWKRSGTDIRHKILLALCMLTLIGCVDILGPGIPSEAVRVDPGPEYAAWWGLMEECTGVSGDMDAVRWYLVPGATTISGEGGPAGRFYRGRHAIVIAERWYREGPLVRHEMLHALLSEVGHPREFFAERCGGLVSCGVECLEDAGSSPAWDLSSPIALPEEIEVSVRVFPELLRPPSATYGCPSIVVDLHNPLGGTVAVDVDRGNSFAWQIEGWGVGAGGAPMLADSLVVLAEGGTWSYAFDCPRLFRADFPPGEYLLRGLFGRLASAPILLQILPAR